jgi:hypothetical protein
MTTDSQATNIPGTMTKPAKYRLTYPLDYPMLQSARRVLRLEKTKTIQYTDNDGNQNLKIHYRLNGVERVAKNLDEYGTVLARELAKSIMKWQPEDGIIHLTQQINMMHQCDPSVKIDASKIPSASYDDRLKGIVVVADTAGFALDTKGTIIELRDMSQVIDKAAKYGIHFARQDHGN